MNAVSSDQQTILTLADNTLSFWRDAFNLADRRSSLEATCLEIKELKAASITGRRHLNDITRAFRTRSATIAATATATNTAAAGAVADMEASMAELLKAYQEEVDQLARRSKFVEVCDRRSCATRVSSSVGDENTVCSACSTYPSSNQPCSLLPRAQAAFYSLYKELVDAPDPAPALQVRIVWDCHGSFGRFAYHRDMSL